MNRAPASKDRLVSGSKISPFVAGAAASGAQAVAVLSMLGVAGLYLLFWSLVCLGVGALGRSSVANGAVLAATWVILSLVLPALAHIAINRANPV